jgi:hypothetical protein
MKMADQPPFLKIETILENEIHCLSLPVWLCSTREGPVAVIRKDKKTFIVPVIVILITLAMAPVAKSEMSFYEITIGVVMCEITANDVILRLPLHRFAGKFCPFDLFILLAYILDRVLKRISEGK